MRLADLHTNHSLCIEYDGRFHYESVERFGGEEKLRRMQLNDQIKTDFCEREGLDLLRIPFFLFDKIEEILRERLGCQH